MDRLASAGRRGFFRENWLWILLPFVLVAALVGGIAAMTDLTQVFPFFYTTR
jgi:hypothetical protein